MDAITRPAVTFQPEKFSDVYEECAALAPAHYQEIAAYQDIYSLNWNTAAYKKAEDADQIAVIAARSGLRLVGYFIMFIMPHPHYVGTLIATEDIHYLVPEFRRGWTGAKLIRAAEAHARERGCKVIFSRTKARLHHDAFYRRLGYELMDLTYTKRLDGD